MSEQTEAGKEFIARIVHQRVPTIERDFWRDDQNKGDTIQHFYFFLEGTRCLSPRVHDQLT
jgi:hypothetical protein